MSVTQARPRAATEDRLHSDLRKLWAALGPGPWTVQGANPDHALAQEILNVRYAGAPIKDLAAASVWIEYLVARGFLTRTQHADNPRVLIYEKAAAIPEPDRRTWAERGSQPSSPSSGPRLTRA